MNTWFDNLGGNHWSSIAIAIGIRLAGAALLLLIGFRIAKWLTKLTERMLLRTSIEFTAVQFLRKVVYILLLIVLTLTVLQIVGVPMTSMIAVLGAAGLAIGLALKDSLSNIASGVMLVTLKPFRVGDIVEIAGASGQVEAISIFQTRLRGADNQTIVLPNSQVTNDSIVNLTPDVKRRIELVVGIGYDDDIDLARDTAMQVMQTEPRILAEPAADVLVYALDDNSVNLGIRCHVSNADFFNTKCDLIERVKKAFDDAGIRIPYPQRDVHMYHHAIGGAKAGPMSTPSVLLPGAAGRGSTQAIEDVAKRPMKAR
ncbi:mechanosensitive ion channel family protein [Luteimonas panaciterrae]|uniref:mechanosensitive ion channel family protein n=1 Tax=Luteimonas panaciterrae TaxID=363885 RepID=UPI001CFB80C3|nr:mechanosensitive ion channel domain-containing protein [Luteimonas panaciterrae]